MIDINLNNYEEYIIDFFDGKLNSSEEQELISFLNAHPDIKEEFEEFELVSLESGNTIFENKDILKKNVSTLKITESNFEELCIAKVEGDLNSKKEKIFNDFIVTDTEKAKTARLFELTKLQAEKSIVYPTKSRLKKSVFATRKAIYAFISAAASIVLVVGLYLHINKNSEILKNNEQIANVEAKTQLEKAEEKIEAKTNIDLNEKLINKRETTHNNIIAKVKVKEIPEEITNVEIEKPEKLEPIKLKQIELNIISVDNKFIANNLSKQTTEKTIQNEDNTEYKNLKSYLASTVKNRLFKKKKDKIEIFDIAKAGVDGINKIAGTKMSLERVCDEKGNANRTQFNSRLIAFSAPVKNNE